MSVHSTFPATWLLGLSLFVALPASGQVPASDSAAPAASDSVETTEASSASSDSIRRRTDQDSVSRADSARAASDTVPQAGTRSPPAADTTRAETATAPTAPSDSILSAACSGPSGPVTVARDLLVIVFAPEAGAAERATAARSVDGRLLGLAPSGQPGAYYLSVPVGGQEHRLRAVADQLIQSDMVRQVGARACPTLPLTDRVRQSSP